MAGDVRKTSGPEESGISQGDLRHNREGEAARRQWRKDD
jgi:hypothetical protein